MPSYRVALQVTDVRPGHRPSAVIDVAARAVREVAHLDKPDLVMEDRQPWVVVRFSIDPTGRAEEDVRARAVLAHVERAVGTVATFDRIRLSRRVRGEWLIVPR
ncbi:hypothetical protein GA0111570_103178 [Raineyella antarctica]|uniref:Uncharacterized protein n=1 Tax=Raineyella antarctica TaxID=1577474 RepID=A0A1G6GG24_9ACTN|nr:hypothetical protein [Raineyella antarctica]SDB80951.1 hypothetical protein GA0111570_103178 [Raineyella antarctica]